MHGVPRKGQGFSSIFPPVRLPAKDAESLLGKVRGKEITPRGIPSPPLPFSSSSGGCGLRGVRNVGGWVAIRPPREGDCAELYQQLPFLPRRFHTAPHGGQNTADSWAQSSRTHLPRGAAARCPEDVDSVPGQVPGDPKPLGSGPQGAPASSMEPLPLRWGGAGPRTVQAAWPRLHARCGRKHSGPLCQAGTTPWPAPPRWQVSPLPAGRPAAISQQQFSALLQAPSSRPRTAPHRGPGCHTSRLPRPRGRPPPGLIINPEAL